MYQNFTNNFAIFLASYFWELSKNKDKLMNIETMDFTMTELI